MAVFYPSSRVQGGPTAGVCCDAPGRAVLALLFPLAAVVRGHAGRYGGGAAARGPEKGTYRPTQGAILPFVSDTGAPSATAAPSPCSFSRSRASLLFLGGTLVICLDNGREKVN